MRARVWGAFAALALALVILAPAISPLPASMDAFATDLSNGSFRPFGESFGKKARGFSGDLGGFTGQSDGNYLPGADEVPPTWVMDRDGRGGNVVIDYVFDPDPGAMKRLKAYDKLGADGVSLEVADKRLSAASADPRVRYDRVVEGQFQVQLRQGEPVPIFHVHPKGYVSAFRTDPPLQTRLQFVRDGADTMYVLAQEDKLVTLNVTYLSASDYYRFEPPSRLAPTDYPQEVRPVLPPDIKEDAEVVWARAGVTDPRDLDEALERLNTYFRGFTEGDIPPPTEVESLYQALALGGKGCCRHRAFAYMVTAQALGVPTRVVVNEAHAFVEVMYPDGGWHQINLGGCGGYTVNNPRNLPSLFQQSSDPRGEANPLEGRPLPTFGTTTDILESPSRIVKGERYYVNGTVRGPEGRGVAGAHVDVFLNETKESPGRLTGAGITGPDGTFSVEARVPADAPARSYQLVARSADATTGSARFAESWSDPPVDVFTPTRFLLPRFTAAAGFPMEVTGRLVDIDGNPVRDARILWTAEGAPQPTLVTDATGAFSGRIAFNATGNRTLELRYEGDAHHGVAVQAARVTVETGAIVLPAEAPTLLRGVSGTVRGGLAVAGIALQDRDVQVTLLRGNATPTPIAAATARTDETGAFAASVDVPAGTPPGVYPVRYQVPGLRLNATGLARVLVPVALAVDAPAALATRDALTVTATLTADNGTRVPYGLVELTLDGNASTTRRLLTNSTGVARFDLPVGALPEGDHVMRVAFVGDGAHAEAQQVRTLQVVPPFWQAIPPWAYATALAAALLLAAAAWGLRREGFLRKVSPALAAALHRRTLTLTFPDHPEGVPPIAEPGGAVSLLAHAHDREGRAVTMRVTLLAAHERRRGRTGEKLALRAPERGALEVEVRARGLARVWTMPARAVVPVVSYREAVERGYVELRRRARLAPSASAGELVAALAPRLRPEAAARLREAAAIFDAADYSEAPIERAHYHAFALARLDVERELPEGALVAA